MSKELEALERIKKWFPFKTNELEYQDICIIETALKRLEQAENCVFTSKEDVKKEHKAFEILKEKKVNLEYLKCCETYEQYKTICSYWNEITQEEFNLLKEKL